MTVGDRVRLSRVLFVIEFWMDWYAAPRRKGREVRAELRSNLLAAAERSSMTEAVAALGSPRQLARDVVAGMGETARPGWGRASVVAVLVHGVLLLAWLLTVVAFVDGATASGPAGRAEGRVSPWWSDVVVEWGPDRFGFDAAIPPAVWLVPLVLFVVLARPWRLVTGRRREPAGP